jgi:NTE family protein
MPEAPSSDAAAQHADDPILIDLALQGGGAHGAFTWGVLDRLLEEPRLRIEGRASTLRGLRNRRSGCS